MNKASVTRFAHRSALKLRKKSPQILFAAGLVGSVATVVLSSRAALKARDSIEEYEDFRAELEDEFSQGNFDGPQYDLAVREGMIRAGVEVTRIYAPVVLVGAFSVICLTRSHQILTDRNTALAAAYSGLHQAMTEYRSRVRQELGDEKDREFLIGTQTKEIEVFDKKGNLKETKEVAVLNENGRSVYSVLFDENNRWWDKHPGYNQTFLEGQQKYANIELAARGHLFLSDVYRLLGIEETKASRVVGWVFDRENGDGYVDFGFSKDGMFMAGYERSVWLDFNVDGNILDLI